MVNPKIFITGASGLVGSNLSKLLIARGYSVQASVRATSNRDRLNDIARTPNGRDGGLTISVADLREIDKLRQNMAGCDVVVHTAAAIDPYGKPEDLYKTNVEGTHNALVAAIAAGAKQFIHISSLSVITGESDQYGATEQAELQYSREAYANSKLKAEELVMAEAAKNRIAVTVLRPGFIYGPNERAWMPRLVSSLKNRKALLVAQGRKETCLIYVDNLCQAIELSLLNPVAYKQIYNLTDGQKVTKKELYDTICDCLNIPRITFSIPVFAARLLVEASCLAAPIAPKRLRASLTRYSRPAFRLAAVNQGFDISKAEKELCYVDRIPFQVGMAQTLKASTKLGAQPKLLHVD